MRLLLGKPCRRKGGRTKAEACEPVQAWPRERGATGADVGATAGAARAVAGAGVAAAASVKIRVDFTWRFTYPVLLKPAC